MIAGALAFRQESIRRPVLLMEIVVLLGFVVFGLLSIFGAVRGSWLMMILGWVIGSAVMLTSLYLGRRSAVRERTLEKEVKKELGVLDELGDLIKGKVARITLIVYFLSLIPMLSVCMIMDILQAVMLFLAQFFVLAITYDATLVYYYRKRYR